MAFHHLGNLLEFALHLPCTSTLFKAYAYVGAGVVAQSARIHLIAGAGYDLHAYQPLDSLMYRCTRDSADHCDIFEGMRALPIMIFKIFLSRLSTDLSI